MRDVFALVFGRDFAELDELIGPGIKGRRINQRRANAERAGFHFPPNEFAHLIELPRRRRFIFESDHVFADRGRADKRGHITRNAAPLEITQIFRQRVPLDFVLNIFLLANDALFHFVVQRPHRSAFAHDFGRDALPDFALRTAILN